MAGWLVGWLVVWLVGELVGGLVAWLAFPTVGWLAGGLGGPNFNEVSLAQSVSTRLQVPRASKRWCT